jgi:hypothetical protein
MVHVDEPFRRVMLTATAFIFQLIASRVTGPATPLRPRMPSHEWPGRWPPALRRRCRCRFVGFAALRASARGMGVNCNRKDRSEPPGRVGGFIVAGPSRASPQRAKERSCFDALGHARTPTCIGPLGHDSQLRGRTAKSKTPENVKPQLPPRHSRGNSSRVPAAAPRGGRCALLS